MRIETSETKAERIAKADRVIVLCQMVIHHQLALVPECELQTRYIEPANQHRRRSAVQWAKASTQQAQATRWRCR